jgi:hypothetical protein
MHSAAARRVFHINASPTWTMVPDHTSIRSHHNSTKPSELIRGALVNLVAMFWVLQRSNASVLAAIATPNQTTLPSMFDFFTNTQPKPIDIWRLPLLELPTSSSASLVTLPAQLREVMSLALILLLTKSSLSSMAINVLPANTCPLYIWAGKFQATQ